MEAICCKRHMSMSMSMSMRSLTIIIIAAIVLVAVKCAEGTAREYEEASTVFIRRSCSSTTYPSLCYTSLVKHADLIQTNRVTLTGAALNVTLASAKSTSAAMVSVARTRGLKPREVGAMQDCVEELGDSVEELRRSIGEMGQLRTANFELTMSDVQTWVSAALTDESTCTDGFQESDMKSSVRGTIVELAQLTSNALALINQLANSHP